MLEIQNLHVKFHSREREAVSGVSLTIRNGEILGLVGESGSGKSVTAMSVAGLLPRKQCDYSGQILLDGQELLHAERSALRKIQGADIGVVFQDFRLIPNMTVYDNIAFSLRVTDASNKLIRQQVPYTLELMELKDKAKKYPYELSGGEQQRVALARALVNDPPLIIADEPTGNIDPEFSYEIVEMLRAINRCGTTIVMVTHEHEMVKYFGGRTINIENGVVVFDDYIGGANESK